MNFFFSHNADGTKGGCPCVADVAHLYVLDAGADLLSEVDAGDLRAQLAECVLVLHVLGAVVLGDHLVPIILPLELLLKTETNESK